MSPKDFPGRRQVEQAIESAEHPTGMHLNDGKERVILPGGTLRRMLRMIDALSEQPAATSGYSTEQVGRMLEFYAGSPAAPVAEKEPVAWRFRYRSKPGMIGNFPWSYTDGKRGRGAMNAEYEYEPLYTHPAEIRGETGGSDE